VRELQSSVDEDEEKEDRQKDWLDEIFPPRKPKK
jgi:hypothetical protein